MCILDDFCYLNPIKNIDKLFIENPKEQFRKVRIRYSSSLEGFGIQFKKYEYYW